VLLLLAACPVLPCCSAAAAAVVAAPAQVWQPLPAALQVLALLPACLLLPA
jgi:hypothetical protein